MTGLSKNPPRPAWIAVYTAHNLPEAQIVAGRLEYEGIPTLVNYPVGGTSMGIYLGAISVLVHPDHYAQALAILETDELDELPDTTDPISYHQDDDDDDD